MSGPVRETAPPADASADDQRLAEGVLAQWPGVVLVVDTEGRLRFANARVQAWLETGPIARPGVELAALHLPWHLDLSTLLAVSAGATRQLPVAPITGRDGALRWCRARLQSLTRTDAPPVVLMTIEEETDGAPQAMADSQRRRALASALVGSWTRSLVTQTGAVDALWCRDLGLDPCDGTDHLERWAKRIHPDDLARWQRVNEQLAEGTLPRGEFEVEYRLLTTDARWIWVLQRGRIGRRGPRGEALEVAGVFVEIDARKRAEVELHEKESRLATALWGAKAAFWQMHVPSARATRSPLWFAMTGYTREQWDAESSPFESRLHPDDAARVRQVYRDHLEGRTQSLEVQYRMRCSDGSWRWMLDRGRVTEWDFDGQPVVALGVSLDIDAQMEAEHALRSSEARLDAAIWGARVGLYELDCRTGVTRWLNDWCDQFGIDSCEGVDHVDRWDANIHPEDVDEARACFAAHLEGNEEYYDAEYRIRTRNGTFRWIYERGRVIERDPAGQPLKLVGSCLDVDARKRSEREARDARRRLQVALEAARGCLWEWDVAARQFNDAYYLLHGVSPEEGRADPDFWRNRAHPDDVERVSTAEQALIEGRLGEFNTEYRVRDAQGRWRWMVDRFRAGERDEHGRAIRLIGFAIDVTEEVEAREALRLSETRMRAVTSSSDDWLLLFDRELRCQFANRGMLGMAVADLIGRGISHFAPPHDVARVERSMRHVLETGEPTDLEQWTDALRGSRQFLEVRLRAVRDGENITGVAVTCVDVTERRELERDLLTVSLREQRRIAHELYNGVGQDLAGVSLMARSLARDLATKDRGDAERLGEVIDLINGAIGALRSIGRGARRRPKSFSSIQQAIGRTVEGYAGRSQAQISFENRLFSDIQLTRDQSMHLLRIAKAALENATANPTTRRVCVSLELVESELVLVVTHDATEPDGQTDGARASGLRDMRFRARLLQALLDIEPAADGVGIALRCRLPVSLEHRAQARRPGTAGA